MSSLIHNRFWGKRNNMGRRTLAKTSLVDKFSQVLVPATVIALDKNIHEEERQIKNPLNQAGKGALTRRGSPSTQRSKLEEDVERLEQRLQQELDLHAAFENAIAHAAGAFPEFPRHLPENAQELLADIAVLEVAVSSLEEQMIALRIQIRYERDARHAAAARWPRHSKKITQSSGYINHGTCSDCDHVSHPLQNQKSNDRTSPAHHLYNHGYNVEFEDELLDMVRLTTSAASPECRLRTGYVPDFPGCSSSTAIGRNQWTAQSDMNDSNAGSSQHDENDNDAVEIEQKNADQGNIDHDRATTHDHQLGQAAATLVNLGPNFNYLLSACSTSASSPSNSYRTTTASSAEGDSSTLTLEESCSYSTQPPTDISSHHHHHRSPAQWQLRSSYKSNDDANQSIVNLHSNIANLGSRSEIIRELWRKPNKLSEEMVSCMIGIYCHLADSSSSAAGVGSAAATPHEMLSVTNSPFNYGRFPSPKSPSELSSAARSPSVDLRSCNGAAAGVMSSTAADDAWYDIDPCINLGTKRVYVNGIGKHGSAVEVSWMSVGKEQLDFAADALRMFRSLVEQLSKVDAASLKHEEKLAFWINVYNALMMHAYLAYGVPRNDMKYFALMQKAAYTVGRHSFNAIAIEHVLLKGRPPAYRPQMALLLALHKLRIPAEAHKLAISHPEPLLTFALSCGAYSSPAVRIYRAESVHAQLEAALEDYALRAWVQEDAGGPNQRIMATTAPSPSTVIRVPKLLYLFARDVLCVDDGDLPSWLNRTFHVPLPRTPQHHPPLPPHPHHHHQQHQHDQDQDMCGHGRSTFTVLPFDFRLRYLFLLDDPPIIDDGSIIPNSLKTRDA